jgi:hypothetical protein
MLQWWLVIWFVSGNTMVVANFRTKDECVIGKTFYVPLFAKEVIDSACVPGIPAPDKKERKQP